MRVPLATSFLLSISLATVHAWCPPGTWQDQNRNCHSGPPPGNAIGYAPNNGGPIVYYNGQNPNGNNRNNGNNNNNNNNNNGGTSNNYNDREKINYIQNGYTTYNNPGQFFDNYPNQGWNPFRNKASVPFIPVNWLEARHIRLVHGVLAGIAFVGLFPFGAMAAALLPGMIGVGVHVAIQMLGFLFYLIAFAMGIWVASNVRWRDFDLVWRTPFCLSPYGD
jgi:hypothetical protein